jgi:hypothetical protein
MLATSIFTFSCLTKLVEGTAMTFDLKNGSKFTGSKIKTVTIASIFYASKRATSNTPPSQMAQIASVTGHHL